MSTTLQLTPESTLADLHLHNCQCDAETLGEVVAVQFEQDPTLPGVIVTTQHRVLGVISRQSFQRRMMRPFALEIFLKRPLKIFFGLDEQDYPVECLQLPYSEKVITAVKIALSRPIDHLYDPILVVFQDDNIPEINAYFLLDAQTLLMAQSKILSAANHKIRQQQRELRQYLTRLQAEQDRSQSYAKQLEQQQHVIQERNCLLESQQAELVQRSQEVDHLNQRFLQIGQLLSLEGKKAFQATFAGVNAICRSTNQVVAVGHLLNQDLGAIYDASQIIAKVSQQVRHLAVQAAIVANHAGAELSGFSTITGEISNLVSQTFDAGRQMDRVANRFKQRIQELTDAAHSGTTTARSLVTKIEQAEIALAELESLVHQHHSDGADGDDRDQDTLHQDDTLHQHPFPQSAPSPDQLDPDHRSLANLRASQRFRHADNDALSTNTPHTTSHNLVQRITQAESMLLELKELVNQDGDDSVLVKIRHTLEAHPRSVG